MGLPNFLCVGAQKAGTSWLYKQLRSHPDIWLPPIKELQYFNHLYVPDDRRWTHGHLKQHAQRAVHWHVKQTNPPDLDYVKYLTHVATESPFTEDWYRYVFDRPGTAGKVSGDVAPGYAGIGTEGIEYVRRLLGDVKNIYLVRDPLDRAISHLRMLADRAYGRPLTWAHLAANPNIRVRSAYSQYVPQWKAAIPERNLLFLPYKRIADNPLLVLREIEVFLGVGAHTYDNLGERVYAAPADLKPPKAIIEEYKQEFGPEREFVRQTFGEQFAQMT